MLDANELSDDVAAPLFAEEDHRQIKACFRVGD